MTAIKTHFIRIEKVQKEYALMRFGEKQYHEVLPNIALAIFDGVTAIEEAAETKKYIERMRNDKTKENPR